MSEVLKQIIIALVFGGVGAFLGFFGIWFFNRMPARWLCDYGQEPTEEMDSARHQRIKTYPWKFVMVAFFVICGIYLGLHDWSFALGAMMALWALLLMAVADYKYMIVPDQLVVVLLVSALGFMPNYISWREPFFGGLVAFGTIASIALLGKLIYKKIVIGGGDIKVFSAIGVLTGWRGFLFIFMFATLLSALNFAILLAKKKIKRGDQRPMIPYVFGAVTIYLLFVQQYIYEIWI